MGWLRRLFSRERLEADLDKELRFHFESQVADKVRSGIPESEARRLTRIEFGGIEQIKEDCRERRGTMWLESLLQDVRYALRQLRKVAWLYATGGADTGAGHRRNHGDLHARAAGDVAIAAGHQTGSACGVSEISPIAATGADTARTATASRATGVSSRGKHTSYSAQTRRDSRIWQRSRRVTCRWQCGAPAHRDCRIQRMASMFPGTFFRPWAFPRGAEGCSSTPTTRRARPRSR